MWGKKLTELSQSKIKTTTLATFEAIKEKIENCGRKLETNNNNKESNENSRSEK